MEAKIVAGESVAKVSDIGATLTKWSVDGEDIIYPFRFIGEKQRGGNPICCPFGSSPKGFEDIPQHGWIRNYKTKWRLNTPSRVVSQSTYKGEYKSYPWWLVAKAMHEVISTPDEDILDTQLKLYRVSAGDEMPINIAFHPYFISHGERDVYINGEREAVAVSKKARCIRINPVDEIIVDTGKFRIKMSLYGFDHGATHLYLWGDSEEYFCIEPVLTPPSYFNTEEGVWLSQEQSIEVSMRLSIAF